MSTIKMLWLGLLLSGSVCVLSCKDDDDPQGCDYVTETQDELNAVNAAINVYIADSSPANCQALKVAYGVYLDDLENHIECAALSGQQAELQASIDQAQASLNTIC